MSGGDWSRFEKPGWRRWIEEGCRIRPHRRIGQVPGFKKKKQKKQKEKHLQMKR